MDDMEKSKMFRSLHIYVYNFDHPCVIKLVLTLEMFKIQKKNLLKFR